MCPEASLLAVSTVGFNLLEEGASSGVCGAWKAAAVSGTFLNPRGRVGCLGFDIHLPPNVYFLCSW